jgi:uncharacterized protein YcbK (DUF882 family)
MQSNLKEIQFYYEPKWISYNEIKCKCGCGINNIDTILLIKFDAIREMVGRPLIVTSACRCLEHNKKEGGAADSMHISTVVRKCRAMDIRAVGDKEVREVVAAAIYYQMPRIFINWANNFIHCDLRTDLDWPVLGTY